MRTTTLTGLTSLVFAFSSTIHAHPSISAVPGPLSQYDATIMSQLNEHLANPELAKLHAHQSTHSHKHFHRRKTSELVDLSIFPEHSKVKRSVTAPVPNNVNNLGQSTNNPSTYYFPNQYSESTPTLSALQLIGSVVDSVSTGYGPWNGSGNIEITSDNVDTLEGLPVTVTISRDSGKGGYINGSKIFLFSDTQSFQGTTASTDGSWVGFCSNTAAVDWGFNAANGQPLALRDRPGAWANSEGTMRNFIPFTVGEQAYNDVMVSNGFRYAIWPSSSLIPINSTNAAVFAPIVFTDSATLAFTYAGATLLDITVPSYQDGRSGPIAQRLNNKIFPESALEWGCIGGIRSWGASGIGGNDGWVYILANDKYGLLVGRTEVANIADASSYEFYNGLTTTWSSNMPAAGSGQNFVNESVSDADIFYSPKHKTFIMIWQDDYIDNQILWSYLEADEPLVPAYDGTDFVENIVKYSWAPVQTLYHAPTPPAGYIYSAGVQMGYFEGNDITNGGDQMLITWTADTGKDAGSLAGGYALMSAVVTWD